MSNAKRGLRTVLGQPSWRIGNDDVEAFVTRLGGHVGPVTFRTPRGVISPYSVAPWAEEDLPKSFPAVLRALRGDFFCAPFGANTRAWRGEQHPLHGEVAGSPWQFEGLERSGGCTTLRLSLETKIRRGRVEKSIMLRDGETAIYSRHVLSGMRGPMNLGHHPMLKFPEREGAALLSSSRIAWGRTSPERFEDPAKGGYSSLKPDAPFSRLDRIPLAAGGHADVSQFPARRGFEDLLMFVHEAAEDFAWTSVVFPQERYAWFALKDPRVLRSTIFWISNAGRHYAPWNGRHDRVMGIEDITGYFAHGLAESAGPNSVNQAGFPTALTLNPRSPLTVNYIMAVAPIPAGFDRVRRILRAKTGVTLVSASGKRVAVPLDHKFLHEPSSTSSSAPTVISVVNLPAFGSHSF